MARIPEELVEQVRDAADIVGIIGESVPLKRTGSDFRGPCPFHGGKNANFAVVPRKGMFHCFVCHEAGDVYTYLMKRFGMDYPTAVRDVARRTGILIPEAGEREGPDPREPLFSACSHAHDWFQRQLRERPDARAARQYLADRELTDEQVALLGLGWAPAGPDFLQAMEALGLSARLLLEAGLAVRRDDGTVHPRFHRRVILPIHDLRGRVVAFGGRLLGPGEPKYLNSPESPVFHKGGTLYHLHAARHAIRKEGSAILVEGYFDVIRLALAGIEHVVAPLGTSCTAEQAELLKRYTAQVTILYDSDAAGLKATFRAADVLLHHGHRVRVATMPPGEDPDTLVRGGGAAALAPVIADAMDVLERKLQLIERKGWLADVAHRREALDRLLPTLRAATDPITRDLYIARVSEATGVGRETLEQEVRSAPPAVPAQAPGTRELQRQAQEDSFSPRHGPASHGAGPPPARAQGRPRGYEEQFLAAMLAGDGWLQRGLEEATPELFEHAAVRELFVALRRSRQRELPADITVEAAQLWSRLRERAASLEAAQVDEQYVGSLERLHVGRAAAELATIADPWERDRRRRELDQRYPNAGFAKTDPWTRRAGGRRGP